MFIIYEVINIYIYILYTLFHIHYMEPIRGKAIFGYTERELSEKKGYDLIHYNDSAYYAAAHQERV